MKQILFFSLALFSPYAFGQTQSNSFISKSGNETGVTVSTNGNATSTALFIKQDWGIRNKKFNIGLGARLTSSFGNNKLEYTTAPARLTTGQTGPAVLFANQITKNIDTLTVQSTQINTLNLFASFRYDFLEKWGAEFNIDLAGFSFGSKTSSDLTYGENSNNKHKSSAKPSNLNLLLIGDNDRGSINSEFMATYKVKPNLRLKAGMVYLFNEYKLDNPVSYTNSLATNVNAETYRAKFVMFGIGVNYVFNK